MEYIVKRTDELTDKELNEICQLFNDTFVGHSVSPASFLSTYSRTPLGFSFHGLMLKEGNVVGVHNNIPFSYVFDGKETLFAYGGGTMVKKEYRDFFSFSKLYNVTEKYATDNGVSLLFGFPNENSHVLFVKGFKHKDLVPLKIYVLPYKVSAVKPKLRLLDFASFLFSRLMLCCSHLARSKNKYVFLVRKEQNSFDKVRYGNGSYNFIKASQFTATYKILELDGVKTCFLLDVYPLSRYNFDKAVRSLDKECRDKVNLIMYVGYLPFCPLSLLTIPRKFEPKKFHFTAKILDKSIIDERVFEVSNWNVNLSNYDLI